MSKPTCTVEDCKSVNDARGYCASHYNRWKRYGDPLGQPVKVARLCDVDGCDRPHWGWGYCNTHGQRYYKHGDPLVVLTPQRQPCKVDHCRHLAKAHGLCIKHARRMKAHGDTTTVLAGGRPPKGDAPSWAAAHKRIHRNMGKAADYWCIDCGKHAQEWSYNNLAADELVDDRMGIRYSLDPIHYEPRCIKCHRGFDAAERRSRRLTLTLTGADND